MSVEAPVAVRLALPKGRMEDGVLKLLREAGVDVHSGARGYRPTVSLPGFEAKVLKPQNIIEMLHFASRDVGFAGADWVSELNANLVELLDTRLDPVRIVAAAPKSLLQADGTLPARPLLVASEYEQLTQRWIAERELDATCVRSFGATEVFPPEDADCIVDNTATGSTLAANDLAIVDELMRSSTRFYASPAAMEDAGKRSAIEDLVLVLRAVLEARKRVMLELNAPKEHLEAIVTLLPCMRQPTIAPLHHDAGYSIRAAVPRDVLAQLIPQIKAAGGSDLVVTGLAQIVP